jgi:hypothetical protein
LKDDILKKLKTLLSGSADLSKKIEVDKAENTVEKLPENEEIVNSIMSQILDSAWVEEELKGTVSPCYTLSKKEKSYWLFNVHLKSYVNIKGGVELILVEVGEKDTICVIGYSMYSIPNDILIYSGWN